MSTEVEMLVFFFGKKHGILTKEQVSTLKPTMTAALERAEYQVTSRYCSLLER